MIPSKPSMISFLLFFSVCLAAQAEPTPTASDVIEKLNAGLLDAMKNAQTLGYEGRVERLGPTIEATHDLPYILRFAIGRKNWEKLSEEDRSRLLDAFRRYSIAAYASRFDGYSGETFTVIDEKPAKRGQTRVDSLLKIPGEEIVDFVYLLKPDEGDPAIVNIIVQGVSDLALKRAEFKALITDKGVQGLLDHLEEQTREYAQAGE